MLDTVGLEVCVLLIFIICIGFMLIRTNVARLTMLDLVMYILLVGSMLAMANFAGVTVLDLIRFIFFIGFMLIMFKFTCWLLEKPFDIDKQKKHKEKQLCLKGDQLDSIFMSLVATVILATYALVIVAVAIVAGSIILACVTYFIQ